MSKKNIEAAYKLACERYAELGVDVEASLKKLLKIPVSLHCWQGDDVRGFESPDGDLTGGIQATGNYPGRARTPQELRGDIEFVLSLVGGSTASTCMPATLNLRTARRSTAMSFSPST